MSQLNFIFVFRKFGIYHRHYQTMVKIQLDYSLRSAMLSSWIEASKKKALYATPIFYPPFQDGLKLLAHHVHTHNHNSQVWVIYPFSSFSFFIFSLAAYICALLSILELSSAKYAFCYFHICHTTIDDPIIKVLFLSYVRCGLDQPTVLAGNL